MGFTQEVLLKQDRGRKDWDQSERSRGSVTKKEKKKMAGSRWFDLNKKRKTGRCQEGRRGGAAEVGDGPSPSSFLGGGTLRRRRLEGEVGRENVPENLLEGTSCPVRRGSKVVNLYLLQSELGVWLHTEKGKKRKGLTGSSIKEMKMEPLISS